MTETEDTKTLNHEWEIEDCEEGSEEGLDEIYDFVDKDLFDRTSQILKNAKKEGA